MKYDAALLDHRADVLKFLKTRFPLYHRSNIFFRDIQYGVRLFMERKGYRIGYTEAERAARWLVEALEKDGILSPIDSQSWSLNYPEFTTPQARPAVKVAPKSAVKMAPTAAPAAQPEAPPAPAPAKTQESGT